jgi:S-ribosylhomocysteine lyase
MKTIKSFEVDHTKLMPGMYLSRQDGDVDTYDLRFYRPNTGVVLENGALHTLEHLFATYLRNTPEQENVIYFGPMGCRTGCYFLVRNAISPQRAVEIIREAAEFAAGFEGEIPGGSAVECGNCKEHDLEGAKREAARYCDILKDWTAEKLAY